MNIVQWGIDIATNPVGAAAITLSGIVFAKLFQYFNAILEPASYVSKLYEAADKVIENVDDRFIDKIRNKNIKKTIQKDLKVVLMARRSKIDKLIAKISD